MSSPFLGEIRTFAFNFAPKGWALCDGQTLSISQNTALFSLLGTTYGGNGQSTFQLPNLQSRVAIHQGQGTGLSPYTMGQEGGVESVALSIGQMPGHSHLVNAAIDTAAYFNPGSKLLGHTAAASPTYVETPPASPVTMASSMIAVTGGSQAHSNIQPYLCVNLCIALQGIFPSRN